VDNIRDFSAEFCHEYDKLEEQVSGSYTELGNFLVVLAELYVAHTIFTPFWKYPLHFRIALGADGAPFSQDDEATAYIIFKCWQACAKPK
jgi:hypothetical protein